MHQWSEHNLGAKRGMVLLKAAWGGNERSRDKYHSHLSIRILTQVGVCLSFKTSHQWILPTVFAPAAVTYLERCIKLEMEHKAMHNASTAQIIVFTLPNIPSLGACWANWQACFDFVRVCSSYLDGWLVYRDNHCSSRCQAMNRV